MGEDEGGAPNKQWHRLHRPVRENYGCEHRSRLLQSEGICCLRGKEQELAKLLPRGKTVLPFSFISYHDAQFRESKTAMTKRRTSDDDDDSLIVCDPTGS